MRIISGELKGRRIVAPKKLPVRPTTDRAKEALFNILMHRFDLHECTVLDLFSGTGNISYEFASRGGTDIVAVDQNRHCTRFIQETANQLDIPVKVVQTDVFQFLASPYRSFDVIFADPPYDLDKTSFENLIAEVLNNDWLIKDGQLIVEHSKQYSFSDHPQCQEERIYGSNKFSFFVPLER